jgi:hypothetical protein
LIEIRNLKYLEKGPPGRMRIAVLMNVRQEPTFILKGCRLPSKAPTILQYYPGDLFEEHLREIRNYP